MKKQHLVIFSIICVFLSFFSGLVGAFIGVGYLSLNSGDNLAGRLTGSKVDVNIVDESSAIIDVAENASPAVVSVVITKDLPTYEYGDDGFFGFNRRQSGTAEQRVGSGSGFIITDDGIIITNKHVVDDEDAHYTVVLNDERQFEAEVLGRDPILDIAVLKIKAEGEGLPTLDIGDSDQIKVGQSVIAIGNSLGRFSNTVSSGIVSGLGRSIIAGDGQGSSERIDGVIQTDASINPGNSGGPLLDIKGNVIGVNVAVAADGENIGFAIPISLVLPVIDSVKEFGEIRRPILGVRYQQITPALAEELKLSVDYGALLIKGANGEPAVAENSAAAAAGLKADDIITEVNGTKLSKTSLQLEIQKYAVGDEVELKYIRDGKENTVKTELKSSE